MKTILSLWLTCSLLTVAISLHAQTNLNPDPNGDPWIVGQLRTLTPEDLQKIHQIPIWQPSCHIPLKNLPVRVDNTTLPWFRPVFAQSGGSCGQASGVGYQFTYEMAYARQVEAWKPENQYPTHFTWNFLNEGVGGGSFYFDGWWIIREMGCPNVPTYGGMAEGGPSRWMNGYDRYRESMDNRVLSINAINVSDEEGLHVLKQWLFSRDDGTQPGGLACFTAGIGYSTVAFLPAGSYEAGKPVMLQWNSSIDHCMTFAGYDDEVCWDYNGDGKYTNDIDITNDGVVDLRDWEKGAMIIVNSWGTGFGFDGKIYMMYKLLAEPVSNGGILNNMVHFCTVAPETTPKISLRLSLTHTSRNKLKILAGVAGDQLITTPSQVYPFSALTCMGGDFYMQGGTSEADKSIEFGLDITPMLSYLTPGSPARFFIEVIESDPDHSAGGQINYCSLINHMAGDQEIHSPDSLIPILSNDTTSIWIDATLSWDQVTILTEELPRGTAGEPYACQLEAEHGTSPLSWNIVYPVTHEISSGTFPSKAWIPLEVSHPDDGMASVSTPFDLNFYGQTYTNLFVLTDGSVIFDSLFMPIRNDAAIPKNKCIAVYGSDLIFDQVPGHGVFYAITGDTLWIRWFGQHFGQPGTVVDVVLGLTASGKISQWYNSSINISGSWGAGLSNGDGINYTISPVSGFARFEEPLCVTYQAGPYPGQMVIHPDGLFTGMAPDSVGSWIIRFHVTDKDRLFSIKPLEFCTLAEAVQEEAGTTNRHISCIPNPFTEKVIIHANGWTEGGVITIFTGNGQSVQSIPFNTLPVTWSGVNAEGHPLPSGIYLIEIRNDRMRLTGSIVKVN